MGGFGVIFFPKFNQIWCVHELHELHSTGTIFLVPSPWGLGKGSKIFNFLNMVMWHIKLKGMSSTQGYTETFYPTIKLVTLGWDQSVNYH